MENKGPMGLWGAEAPEGIPCPRSGAEEGVCVYFQRASLGESRITSFFLQTFLAVVLSFQWKKCQTPEAAKKGFFFGLENVLFQGTIIIFPLVILPVIFSSEQPFPVGSLPASQPILALPVLVRAPVRGEK